MLSLEEGVEVREPRAQGCDVVIIEHPAGETTQP